MMALLMLLSLLCAISNGLPKSIDIANGDQDVTILGIDNDDFLGNFGSLISGDFNGDGVQDIAIGAPYADGPGNKRPDAGEVYILYGPLHSGTTIDLGGIFIAGLGPTTIYGADPGDQFGSSLATGDVNGDGVADLIIGAPYGDGFGNKKDDAGEVYVILGKPNLSSTAIIDAGKSGQDMVIFGEDAHDLAGSSVASGDINGDTIDDIIIGSANADSLLNKRGNAGQVYAIYGKISPPPAIDLASRPAELTIFGAAIGDSLGEVVLSADVNGDGLDDIIIGAPRADGVMKRDAGKVYIVLGDKSLPSSIDTFEGADITIIGGNVDDFLGESLATGDVNGDSISDVIIAARFADGPGNERRDAGEVYIVYGRPSLPQIIDVAREEQDVIIFGEMAGDYLGSAVHSADLNKDGIDDIIIGAMLAEGLGPGRRDSGRAYVIFGSSNLPARVDTRSLEIERPDQYTIIYGAEPDDRLGAALTSGDVDGDKIDDLIISAVNADGPGNRRKDAGEVYVILGSTFAPANKPPVADAGPDQEVTVGATVQLDGSGSRDPDGDPLNFKWEIITKPEGSVATLSNPRIARPTFVADRVGDYTVKLTVDDGRGGSDTAQVRITAVPPPGLKGDVDLDGDVDIIDARLAAEFIVGLADLGPEQRWAADVHEPCRPPDKNIDVTDVRWIAEFSLGLQKEMGCYEGIQAMQAGLMGLNSVTKPIKLLLKGGETVTPGGVTTIRLIIKGAGTELADLQVGPRAFIKFDPKVLQVKALRGVAPYKVVASQVNNLSGEVRFALTSLDGKFSSELIVEMEVLLIGNPGKSNEVTLTGLDVLRDSKGHDLKAALGLKSAKVRIRPIARKISKLNPIVDNKWQNKIEFRTSIERPEAIKVEVYDLSGRIIFISDWTEGNRLEWHLEDSLGKAVANGIYLYMITARDSMGRLIKSDVAKLVVTR
jgi:hypothetical protein